MLKNIKSHNFQGEKSAGLTEDGHEKFNQGTNQLNGTGISNEPEKPWKQNQEFHHLFCSIITEEIDKFQEEFQEWMIHAASDEDFLSAPLTVVLRDFFQLQQEYLQVIEEFAAMHREHISPEQLAAWNQRATATANELILAFTVQHTKAAQQRSDAQQELIEEISAPLILLTPNTGLLPLVGEITAQRAQSIYDKMLNQCGDAKLEKLFIDLTGVSMIDTKGSHLIFQLIDGLKIIGVQISLAGISPFMAKLFIQSGFDFSKIEISNTLIEAMRMKNPLVH